MMGTHTGLERKSTHSVLEVLNRAPRHTGPQHPTSFILDGDEIRADIKFRLFHSKGVACARCGVRGLFFAKERWPDVDCWHLNLYAITAGGDEVMLTKDHIQPKIYGGSSTLDNLDVLCKTCNEAKGSEWSEAWEGAPGC